MTKSKGYRARTRSLLRRKPRERGKISLSKILYNYKPGDKAVIKIDPSVHKGMPHRRYQGKIGVIVKCVIILIDKFYKIGLINNLEIIGI